MNNKNFELLMECIFYSIMIISLSTCTVMTHEPKCNTNAQKVEGIK